MINYDKIIDNMSVTELVGQVMCDFFPKGSKEEAVAYYEKYKPGGIFVTWRMTDADKMKDEIQWNIDAITKASKIPAIIAADIEHGPGSHLLKETTLPNNMAWGACNDADLIYKAGIETAKICRQYGVHWTFGPIVDLNINPNNPESNIRSISDDPERVVKIGGAHLKGLTEKGYMVTSCKHFPGQGYDDRNSHFVTVNNGLSQEEWLNTYGYVYKKMIEQGTASIMVGHISLPAFEKSQPDQTGGYLPATLSKSLMTDLLKEKLGFKGCIVSDAMGMIGVAARMPLDRVAVEFIKAGGDMYLFPKPRDYENLYKAVESGEISMERLKDAVRRVLYMKDKARLFENQAEVLAEIDNDFDLSKTAQQIADKSIKVVRNLNNTIPIKLKKGAKVLFLNMVEKFYHEEPDGNEFDAFKQAFEERGYVVDQIFRPTYEQTKKAVFDYDLVLLNCKMSSRDYHGGSLRVAWDNIMVLWHAIVLQHPNVIFTSFGDPYKLYEFPYLKEYVNVFSFTKESQIAAAKVILGEIKAQGKNPVTLKGYFERED